MYIILEHSGTKNSMDIASEILLMLEERGHKVDQIITNTDVITLHQIITNTDVITLYDEDRKVIANFDKVPDENLLNFYVGLCNEEVDNEETRRG